MQPAGHSAVASVLLSRSHVSEGFVGVPVQVAGICVAVPVHVAITSVAVPVHVPCGGLKSHPAGHLLVLSVLESRSHIIDALEALPAHIAMASAAPLHDLKLVVQGVTTALPS